MPTWLVVVLAVFVVLVVVLFVLGTFGARRHRDQLDERFHAQLEEANAALATARAEDRGWERAGLERAAREAHMARNSGAQIRELHLVQVIDRPGTDADQARFRLIDAEGEHDIVLVRRGETWLEAP